MSITIAFLFFKRPDQRYAHAMVESTHHMMHANVVQLSDADTPPVHPKVTVHRLPFTSLSEFYFMQVATFPSRADVLLVDHDVLFKCNVEYVFEEPFDIACAVEQKGILNAGVTFLRDKAAYAAELRRQYENTNKDEWNALQVARQLAIDSGRFRVRKLPREYNYIPDKPDDTRGAKILHYKGDKKVWMLN